MEMKKVLVTVVPHAKSVRPKLLLDPNQQQNPVLCSKW